MCFVFLNGRLKYTLVNFPKVYLDAKIIKFSTFLTFFKLFSIPNGHFTHNQRILANFSLQFSSDWALPFPILVYLVYIRYKHHTNIQNLTYRDIDFKQIFQKNVASLFPDIFLFPWNVFECTEVAWRFLFPWRRFLHSGSIIS